MENPLQNNDPRQRFSLWDLIKTAWNPQPIKPPTVDPQLSELCGLQRSTESILFSMLSIEFWISPSGQVREWLRHNSRLAIILAIPAFLVLPIITFALWQLVSWLVALTSIAGKIIVLPIMVLLAVVVIAAVVWLLKAIFSNR
jgi:hypothetical protein